MAVIWELESKSELMASEDLNVICQGALKGSRSAQNYLRKLWDNESWSSIKEKLQTEGSVYYVWWMDGVRQHLLNIQNGA